MEIIPSNESRTTVRKKKPNCADETEAGEQMGFLSRTSLVSLVEIIKKNAFIILVAGPLRRSMRVAKKN